MDALGTLLEAADPVLRHGQPRRLRQASSTRSAASTSTSPDGFCDPHYSEYGYEHGFSITAGRHHLNGNQALAYARVRKPAGESDFTRAARQQEVVSGIRDAIVQGGFINDPVGLHQGDRRDGRDERAAQGAAGPGRGGQPASGATQTYRAVITHPLVRGAYDERGSIQVPDIPDIRALAASALPTERDAPAGPSTRRPSPAARSAAAA